MKNKYYSFSEIHGKEFSKGLDGKKPTQLMYMYKVCMSMKNPSILELGTNQGASTVTFLKACERNGGRLISVDVKDCSYLFENDSWTFVKSSSLDRDKIFNQVVDLNKGIDILLIDTIHKREHVEKELLLWYPYLKKDSHVFIDDVDSFPYRKGQKKESLKTQNEIDGVQEFIKNFYYKNQEVLYFNMLYGSTGMAHFYKIDDIGATPN